MLAMILLLMPQAGYADPAWLHAFDRYPDAHAFAEAVAWSEEAARLEAAGDFGADWSEACRLRGAWEDLLNARAWSRPPFSEFSHPQRLAWLRSLRSRLALLDFHAGYIR